MCIFGFGNDWMHGEKHTDKKATLTVLTEQAFESTVQMRASAMEDENENLDIQVVTSAAGSKYAKVTLAYRYTIPLLNMLLEHQITGYAK